MKTAFKNIILVILMTLLIMCLSLKVAFSSFEGILTTLFLFAICSTLIFTVLQDKGKTSKIEKVNKISIIGIVVTTIISMVSCLGAENNISANILYLILAISIIVYLITEKQMKLSNKHTKTNSIVLTMGIISLMFYCICLNVNLLDLAITPFSISILSIFGVKKENIYDSIMDNILRIQPFLILTIIFFIIYFWQKKKNNIYKTKGMIKMFCNNCGSKVENGDVFCNNCGYKLENNQTVPQYNYPMSSDNMKQEYLQNMNNNQYNTNRKSNYSTAAKVIITIMIIGIIAIIIIPGVLFIHNIFKQATNNNETTNYSFENNSYDVMPNNPNASENNSISKYQIMGNSWVEQTDDSLLNLNIDETFKYYKDKDILTNNYYEGTYKVYVGKEAVKYVTYDLEKYGVTAEELEEIFARNSKYSEENFCCIVLTNEKCMVDGINTLISVVETPYFGFYLGDGTLNIANMNVGKYVYFVKQN